MAITTITNPLASPKSNEDYKNQNKILKTIRYNTRLNVSFDSDTHVLTIKAGSYFEYNGFLYDVNADENIDIDARYIFNYITFDGENFSVIQSRPFGNWDNSKNGYYNGNVKYFDLGVLQYNNETAEGMNRAVTENTTMNNFVRLKNAFVGQVYIRYPYTPRPENFYWGMWQNVSAEYAGHFFRAEGGDSLAYDGGVQGHQMNLHNHSYNIWIRLEDGGTASGGTKPITANLWDEEASLDPQSFRYTETSGNEGNFGSETRPVNQTIQIYICNNRRC